MGYRGPAGGHEVAEVQCARLTCRTRFFLLTLCCMRIADPGPKRLSVSLAGLSNVTLAFIRGFVKVDCGFEDHVLNEDGSSNDQVDCAVSGASGA